ncbi:integrase [Xenorhabdus stockiae]|uniref:Integrase n=1 Tax=Xenorhabdus stockiae TaxID=351614 RepID=A0A2D0KKX6_9GAMM|nr:integrase arm-type DNA-binding domain-containing protein [Xenorhabdus stockiae]PHM63975.1 integrase [Xenorhabdus stockiae]
MPLTDAKARNAKPRNKPYNLTDGRGLYLEVRPSGNKFWRYRYWITPTKDGRYTIGEYPYISLSEARSEIDRLRSIVKSGVNPTDERNNRRQEVESDKLNTFKAISSEWFENKKEILSKSTINAYKCFLSKHCYPSIGDKQIKTIKPIDILNMIKAIEKSGAPQSAIKVRALCSSVFKYAISNLKAEFDPCQVVSGSIIPPKTNHSRCLSRDEIKRYFSLIESSNINRVTRVFLKLLPFLFVRQSELRLSKVTEFNFELMIWTIDKSRMKMGKTHSVPLSPYVGKLIKEAESYSQSNEFLFSINGKKPIGRDLPNESIVNSGFKLSEITTHDFRATASTMLYEMGFRSEIIEKQLAHSQRNRVAAAYNHAEYMEERIEMMRVWENTLLDIINS